MNKFNIGDLVEYMTLFAIPNRKYGVVVDSLSIEYEKINTVKCAWYDGTLSWVHKSQLELISKGQNGKLS